MSDEKRDPTEMNPDDLAGRPDGSAQRVEGSLPPELQGAIGKQLKHIYGQMLAEPMPDKFAQLLESLGKSEQKS